MKAKMILTSLMVFAMYAFGWAGQNQLGKFGNSEECDAQLIKSSSIGDIKKVQALIRRGTVVKCRTRIGWTPLMMAAYEGHLAVVLVLVENGADINAHDAENQSPLLWATFRNNVEVGKLLIDRGADVNVKDDRGWTPLFQVASDAAVIVGTSPHLLEDTPIRWGQERKFQFAKLLINSGADVNAKDSNNQTALQIAALWGNISIAKILIDNGASVDNRDSFGITALMLAAMNSHDEVVKLLLSVGANINVTDNNGKTALNYASERNNMAIVQLLKAADKAQ